MYNFIKIKTFIIYNTITLINRNVCGNLSKQVDYEYFNRETTQRARKMDPLIPSAQAY